MNLDNESRSAFRWIGHLTEWLADRRLDHEARHGSQVLAGGRLDAGVVPGSHLPR